MNAARCAFSILIDSPHNFLSTIAVMEIDIEDDNSLPKMMFSVERIVDLTTYNKEKHKLTSTLSVFR